MPQEAMAEGLEPFQVKPLSTPPRCHLAAALTSKALCVQLPIVPDTAAQEAGGALAHLCSIALAGGQMLSRCAAQVQSRLSPWAPSARSQTQAPQQTRVLPPSVAGDARAYTPVATPTPPNAHAAGVCAYPKRLGQLSK